MNVNSQNEIPWSHLKWNSFYSDKHKLFYVATPKVACTSLKWWFCNLVGFVDSVQQCDKSIESDPALIIHDNFYRVAPDVTGLDKDKLLPVLSSSDCFRFCLVRNPFRRIFSAWQSKWLLKEPLQIGSYTQFPFLNLPIDNYLAIQIAFEEFLEHLFEYEYPQFMDVHVTPQFNLLRPDLISFSVVSHIENLIDLSIKLTDHLNADYLNPFLNITNDSLLPFSEIFISNRSIDLIRKMYADDFIHFGYSLDVPFSTEPLSQGLFDLAIKSIHMLRGRHQRIGEMRTAFHKDIVNHQDQLNLQNKTIIGLRDQLAISTATILHVKEELISLTRLLLSGFHIDTLNPQFENSRSVTKEFELEEILGQLRFEMHKHNLIITEQQLQINDYLKTNQQLHDEFVRAEAQLDLLKQLMFEPGKFGNI